MSANLEIKTATVQDLADVDALDRAVFAEGGYGYVGLRQLFDLANPAAVVAVDDTGRTIGYAMAARASTPGVFWFLVLGVLPARRREGIGHDLAEKIVTITRAQGAKQIRLTVHPRNNAAIGLYEALGFEIKGKEDAYFGEGEPRLVMALASSDHSLK